MSDLIERLLSCGETSESEQDRDCYAAGKEIERLTALTEADRKEIGSYRDGTGLRGEWRAANERIAKLEAALDTIYNDNKAARDTVIKHYGIWHNSEALEVETDE